jgi:elongation factor G
VVTAVVPARYLGDVLNDLSGRRGRVIGTTQDDDMLVTVTAHVPEAQLHRYGLDLRSMTSGLGRASIEPHHLAEAPKTATTKAAVGH